MSSDAAVRLTPVHCAFGGTGVSPPGHSGILLYVDAAAVRDVARLRVSAIEVLDPSGAVAVHAVAPIELRLALPGRDQDHNLLTAAFSGVLRAGEAVRLVASARLTVASGRLEDARYRATFAGDDGAAGPRSLSVEGTLDTAWCTAGPAVPP